MLARVIAMLTPLVTVPLTLGYLGQERYGLWQTIVSFGGLLAFTDLGLGNGILTQVSRANGQEDKALAMRIVSSAFFMLLGMAGLFLILFCLCSPFIHWSKVFNTATPLAAAEAGPAMTVFIVCFALNIPMAMVQKVQAAYQQGFNSNLWQSAGNLAALGVVIAVVYGRMSLPMMLVGLSGVPVLFTALNAATYFGRQNPWLRPRRQHFHWHTAKKLLHTGSSFLVISILMCIGMGADNLITAQMLGPNAVAQLSVPVRLTMPLVAVAQMLYMPMWSANGEAIARGEIAWVRQAVAKMTKLTILFTGTGALVVILLGPWAVGLLTRHTLTTNYWLLSGLGAWAILVAAVGPNFMVLNAAHVLRPQILIYTIFLIFSLPAKIWLASRIGIEGIVWAGVVIHFFVVFLPLRILVRHTLASLDARNGLPQY
jgi:O-antigen/teichoic acid export membrane protein